MTKYESTSAFSSIDLTELAGVTGGEQTPADKLADSVESTVCYVQGKGRDCKGGGGIASRKPNNK